MKPQIKYIELKSGYGTNENGPAWIGKVEFSKSGKTIYFNGKAFRGNGHGSAYDIETRDLYWISGIKKNMRDRHWAGSGFIMIDKTIIDEYMKMVGVDTLDPKQYIPVDIEPTDKQKFAKYENMPEWDFHSEWWKEFTPPSL
jgi:hypothetical protein